MRSKLYRNTDVMTVLSKLRTRNLRTFGRPETNQGRVVLNHKCHVVQLESIECLRRFRLDERDLLLLGVLVDELCYVAVTSKRCGNDGSHEVDGD